MSETGTKTPPQDTRVKRTSKPGRKRNTPYRYLLLLGITFVLAVTSTILAIVNRVKYKSQQKTFVEAGISDPAYSLDAASQMAAAAKEAGRREVLDDMQASFAGGTSTLTYLRTVFADKLVYPDDGHYVFVDIDKSLAMHNLNPSAFSTDESGFMTYNDAAVTAHRGIDVSKYQGSIDWNLVKNDGIEFAFLRVGYRSYGTGVIKEDETFNANAAGAIQNGIHTGVYFFSQAVTTDEAKEEAEFVINALKPFKIDYPVVIDIEEITDDTYRQQDISRDELTDIIIAFCEEIQSAGYTPMIYANLKGFASLVDISRLDGYEKWYAEYTSAPYIPYDISIWQYSDSGSVSGISGAVDLNISFRTW